MTYRAVFFDAGETLVHPHPSFPELFGQILADEGFTVGPDDLRDALHVVFARFDRAARERELWTISPERSKSFWLEVYGTLLERLGLGLADGLPQRLYAEFTLLSNYRLFPDAVPALQRLQDEGLVLGVVSNFEAWLERLLDELGVTPFFDVMVISGLEGMEKPDPRIFELALARAGVAADDAVYVGDNPAFDTEPAEALGMLGVLIDRRKRFPAHAGRRIDTLTDLPSVLAAMEATA